MLKKIKFIFEIVKIILFTYFYSIIFYKFFIVPFHAFSEYYFMYIEFYYAFKFDLGDYNMYEEIDDLKDVFNDFRAWLVPYFMFKPVIIIIFQCLISLFFIFLINFFNNIIFFFTLFFLLIIFYFSNKNKKFLLSKNIDLYFFYNKILVNKNNLFIFFGINFFLIFSFIIYYIFFFFNNVYSHMNILFYKKLKFFNVHLDLVLSLDYISIYFIILTFFIFFIIYFTFFSLKFKKDVDKKKIVTVMFIFLIIEFLLFLTFATSNIFFFFFFFECSLIPMYILLILLGKGTKKKYYAGFALVFYTLLGSIFLLLGILYLINITNTCDFKNLNFELIDFNSQFFLFFLFFLGFSVKVPIFPFYSWLPEAHVEASTNVSILLASIFLKVATYGFLKIIIFNFFIISYYYYSVIFYFCLISVFLASFLSLMQTDLKKIVALSSIIHMNYMVIALFSLEPKAIFASFVYMFSHAFVSSGMFYLIGILYENNGSRDLLNFSNSLKNDSKFFIFFLFFNFSNISFPLTISFISEIMILNNLVFLNVFILILILISVLISIIYTFWIIHNVMYGKFFLKKNSFFLNKFDLYFLSFLCIIIITLGILPFLITFNLEQEIYIILINKFNIY